MGDVVIKDAPTSKLEDLRKVELERGVREWYLLVFVDGKEQLGAAIVEARGPADAALRTAEMGIDPGRGRVTMTTVALEYLPAPDKRDRLLTFAEVREIFPPEGG